jgi:hexosaminidase
MRFCLFAFLATILPYASGNSGLALHPQIPALLSFESEVNGGFFSLNSYTRIIVNASGTHLGHDTPSLLDYATTFRSDLQELLAFSSLTHVSIISDKPTSDLSHDKGSIILLTVGASNLTHLNGSPTGEAYEVDVSRTKLTIRGANPIGTWWGTRTVLQQVALAMGGNTHKEGDTLVKFPTGKVRDSPGWPVRGFMLDAGRHWFEPQFLGEHYIHFFQHHDQLD